MCLYWQWVGDNYKFIIMKKIIIAALLLITIGVSAQNKDSLAQVQINKFVDSIGKTAVNSFISFVYESVPAKKYEELMRLYNAYLEARYKEYLDKSKNK